MQERLVFFGNERLATGVTTKAPTLRALIDKGYPIAAVVANYAPGQSRSAHDLEVAEIASDHNIPLLLPDKLVDISDQLRQYQATAAILVAYGKIVPQSIIDIFPRGIINIHPSLLPQHRGPTPIESVILEGSNRTGVSLMSLAKAMDAGPVYSQAELELDGTETKQHLADRLLGLGGDMLMAQLPDILAGKLIAAPQSETGVTYDKLITKADGQLDWRKPALQLARDIRAYAGWPKSHTRLFGFDMLILDAQVVEKTINPGALAIVPGKQRQLLVGCGSASLALNMIQPTGKKAMTAEAFINGYLRHVIKNTTKTGDIELIS